MSSRTMFFFGALFAFYLNSEGSVRHVPLQYLKIQDAINASLSGDTIIVDPGIYYENINFRGKNVVVASRYTYNFNTAYIESTVIDGSHPVFPDTASAVIINSGEDSTAVLEGFTITGGTGTKWLDIHIGGLYREGGGILTELSSPTIRNNLIRNNSAVNTAGCVSAGGGGMRCSDGNPHILNNIIMENNGRYGGGIVLNFCGGVIKNNVIFRNTGGQDYGGSGIWVYENWSSPKILENNVILENKSALMGGGLRVWSTSVTLRNSIIWGNEAPTGAQLYVQGGTANVTYSDVQGGRAGIGNIDADPQFTDTSFYLSASSPCRDAGDPGTSYNDPENPGNPGSALWPSLGTLRNDVGAYGGPGRTASPFLYVHMADPLPPSNQAAYSDYSTPGSIRLIWQDPVRDKSGRVLANFKIHIYRNLAFIAAVDSGVQTFTDTGLVLHQLYTYGLLAARSNDSSVSVSASAYAGGHASPQPPSAFSVRDALEGVNLTWRNPSLQMDNTPLNDLAAILIYRDSVLVNTIPQGPADTGSVCSYLDSVRGYHTYMVQAADNEIPTHYSALTQGLLGSNILEEFD